MGPLKHFGISKDKYGKNMAHWTDPYLTRELKQSQHDEDNTRGVDHLGRHKGRRVLELMDSLSVGGRGVWVLNREGYSARDYVHRGSYENTPRRGIDKAGYYDLESKQDLKKSIRAEYPGTRVEELDLMTPKKTIKSTETPTVLRSRQKIKPPLQYIDNNGNERFYDYNNKNNVFPPHTYFNRNGDLIRIQPIKRGE